MNNTYVENYDEIKKRFEGWWQHQDIGRPLMRIIARGKKGNLAKPDEPADLKDLYLDPLYLTAKYRNYCESHYFMADAYPNLSCDIGPGSIAVYLGSEPKFASDTVWFTECLESAEEFKNLHYDENNKWLILHRQVLAKLKELSKGDFLVNIPDMMENLDILSAMRGPGAMCFDMIDYPDEVLEGVKFIDSVFFKYYNWFYDLLKEKDGTASFTAFNVLAEGRIAKIQCDFSALINPEMFRENVQPSLRKQCGNLKYSIYHLDGPDAIKHLDALMEIEELDALQWTCGAGQPDGACERWYPIYDKVRAAGKSLWIQIEDGKPADWADSTQRILDKYGSHGIYFLYPEFDDLEQAQRHIEKFSK
jgi:5-methyltetrahydrofolate--homocysteine methyltransferase